MTDPLLYTLVATNLSVSICVLARVLRSKGTPMAIDLGKLTTAVDGIVTTTGSIAHIAATADAAQATKDAATQAAIDAQAARLIEAEQALATAAGLAPEPVVVVAPEAPAS